MQSAILGIGRELVSAQIKDNNAYYIAKRLSEIGIENKFIVFLDDEVDEIAQAISYFSKKTQLIITSGGLGPTFDDLTLQALSLSIGEELILNQECLSEIESFYYKLYIEGKIADKTLNINRKKMAYVPKNSVLLKNTQGAACGVYVNKNDVHIFCLPGVPLEMKTMFETQVAPILKTICVPMFSMTQTIEINSNDESLLAFASKKTVDKTNVYVKTLPVGFSLDTMCVRFTAKAPTKDQAKAKLEEAIAFFRSHLPRL